MMVVKLIIFWLKKFLVKTCPKKKRRLISPSWKGVWILLEGENYKTNKRKENKCGAKYNGEQKNMIRINLMKDMKIWIVTGKKKKKMMKRE